MDEKITNDNENLNNLYNYGESLAKELKSSNDKNTELLMKYINLKAELQIKENQNKELENKIKSLNKEQIVLNKSNQEFAQNISCVQKIVDNNKIASIKSISESEKIINLNQKKINELNLINKNLFNFKKQYENEIDRLKNVLNNYELDDKILEKLEKNIENENNDDEFNILEELDKLKTTNLNLQNEMEQLENIYNLNFDDLKNNLSGDASSMNETAKEIQNYNHELIDEIIYLKNELKLKNKILEESKKEISDMNDNIKILEYEKTKEEEYLTLKNKNIENRKKLDELDEEIENLMKNLNQIKNNYDEGINKLNEIYISQKENSIFGKIENEIKETTEENEKIKSENNEIIKYLEDLQDLNNEYEKIIQINSKLKENL